MPLIGTFGTSSVRGFGQRNGASSPFIVASGGTETYDGDYKIHTFTSSGCFVVCTAGSPSDCGGDGSYVDYLVVLAGGDGNEGGGGGGGMRSSNRTYPTSTGSVGSTPTSGIQVSESTTYPIVVGASGGQRGGESSFGPITSTGGGNGGRIPPGQHISNPGGSGGGGGHRMGGGTGNQPPVSPPQGQKEHLLYLIQRERLTMEKVAVAWEVLDQEETDQTEALEEMEGLQILQEQVQFMEPEVAAEFIIIQADLEELQGDLVLQLQVQEELVVGMLKLDKTAEVVAEVSQEVDQLEGVVIIRYKVA